MVVLLRNAVEIAFAALPFLALAFAARWFNIWAQLDIPAPDPQMELLAIFGFAFLLAAALENIIRVANNIVLLVLAIGFATMGAALGATVREWALQGNIRVEYVAAGVLLFTLPSLALWLWKQLGGTGWSLPQLGAAGPVIIVVLVAAIATFTLLPFFVVDWNQHIATLYPPLLMLTPSPPQVGLLATLQDLKELAGEIKSVSSLFGVAFAAAATYIVVKVPPELARITDYLGLDTDQISAAKKLHNTLSDLVRETKPRDTIFKRELIITPESIERESPIESPRVGGARVKIIVRTGGTPGAFTFERLKTFLDRAQIEIRDSLFFVYLDDPAARWKPVCYGTGPEMWELMQKNEGAGDDGRPASGRFRGEFSSSFFAALNSGTAPAIGAVVDNARKFVLANNPLDDVLLTTFPLEETMEVGEALTEMRKRNLRRALIVSAKTPTERAILGVPSIAAYLWSGPEQVSPSTDGE